MKIRATSYTEIEIITESPEDLYKLGRLEEKIKGARAYSVGDNTKKLELNLRDLLDAILNK
jgi:hypothetical protein